MKGKKILLKKKDGRKADEVRKNSKQIERNVAKINGDGGTCDLCEKTFLNEELKKHPDTDDEHVCPECLTKQKCELCDTLFPKDELKSITNTSGEIQHVHVCEDCESQTISDDEREPIATVTYSDDDVPATIGHYHNHTDGDFKPQYHRIDGWRGSWDIIPSDKWVSAHTDCILAYSEDAGKLERFDEEFQYILKEKHIRFARVISVTSNVFCANYDFFIEKEKASEAEAIRIVLTLRFRDPERQASTALTGADPKDQTKEDKLFIKAVKLVENGMSAEDAVKKIIEEEE